MRCAFITLLLISFLHVLDAYFFGYYATNLTETNLIQNIYFESSNIEEAKDIYEKYKIQSLLLVEDVFFTFNQSLVLIQGWEAKWNAFYALAEPLLEKNITLGFNLGDELVWNCLSPADLITAANAVRSKCIRGKCIIWYNEAAFFGSPSRGENSCSKPVPDFAIPEALDWFSVDIYHFDGKVDSWVANNVQTYYNNWIFPNLTASQSVILVPGSFGSDVNHYPDGTEICNRTCYDQLCSHDAYDFDSWAKTDKRVAGIFPWNWGGCPTCNGSRFTPPNTCCMDELGTKVMNVTKQTWETIIGNKPKRSIFENELYNERLAQ